MAEETNLFDPDEAVEGGGGLLQAVQGAVLTFEAVSYDYNGSVAVPVPAIHVHGEFTDAEGAEGTFEEYYSMGDASKFRPRKDGTRFESLTEGARPTKTCKGMQLISSIISANGGDKSIITGNIKDLDGINVDMERKPDVDRPGLEAPKRGTRTIFLVTTINALPGETPRKGAKGKVPAGKPAAKGKNLRAKAIEAVVKAIDASDGSLAITDLPQVVFRLYKKDPDCKALTEFVSDEDFLVAEDTPWGNDGTTLTSGS